MRSILSCFKGIGPLLLRFLWGGLPGSNESQGLYTTSSWHLASASTTGAGSSIRVTSLVDHTDQNHLLYCTSRSFHSETSFSEHGLSMRAHRKFHRLPHSKTLDVIQPHISDLLPWKLCWSVAMPRIPIWASTIFPTFCQKPRKWACF